MGWYDYDTNTIISNLNLLKFVSFWVALNVIIFHELSIKGFKNCYIIFVELKDEQKWEQTILVLTANILK